VGNWVIFLHLVGVVEMLDYSKFFFHSYCVFIAIKCWKCRCCGDSLNEWA